MLVALCLSPFAALAQGAVAEGWSGQLGVSYGIALSSDGAAPLSGPIIRADLSYRSGERQFSVRSDPVSLDRLDLAFELRERNDLLSVRFARDPADSDAIAAQRGARSDLQVLALRRGERGPTLQALVNAQRVAGTGGSATLLTRVALNDRIRDPGWGLSSLDWRAALQLQQVDVPAAGVGRTTTTASFGVGGAFGGDDGRRWRPTAGLELSSERGSSSAERSRVDLGLSGELTGSEQLSVRLRWDLETVEAGTRLAQQQRLGLSSRRFAPLRLTLDGERRVDLTGRTALSWSAGADAPLSERWTLGVSYRGSATLGGASSGAGAAEVASEHGLSARLGVQSASSAATLRGNAEVGATWSDADGWRPTAALTLSAARRGEGPFSGTVAGSLRYGDAWAGAVNASGSLDLDWGDLSVNAEATLADALTLSGGAVLAVRLFDPVAAQLGASVRSTLGRGTSASIDLGARYSFGGR